jgi:hypothetical protein
MNNEGQERLTHTLSKFYPLETVSWTEEGDEPRLCWKFFRPDPPIYFRISEALQTFRGALSWTLEANGDTDCLRAAQVQLTFVSPGQFPTSSEAEGDHCQLRVDRGDLEALSDYLEQVFNLQDLAPKSLDKAWFGSPEARKQQTDLRIFYEPGLYQVILSQNPKATLVGQKCGDRLEIPFSVTEKEWEAIFVGVLGVKQIQQFLEKRYSPSGQILSSRSFAFRFDDPLPNNPYLSKFRDIRDDVIVESPEVDGFLAECLSLQDHTKNQLALRGIDKLIRTAILAEHHKQGILMFFKEEE